MAEKRDWKSEPISTLGLSLRANGAVKRTRAATIGELCDLTEDDFMGSGGFPETSLREVKAKLAELGLKFRDLGAE